MCAFIDNTMFAFCRPGGNTTDGPAAPRVPLEVQEAWWTGWKKLHGLKWQTVILACGMDVDVSGPVSVRQNDVTQLHTSNIEERWLQLQEGQPTVFKMYGDSAYNWSDAMSTGIGRGYSSVRETVEFTYKDTKGQWKYCDYKHVLRLRQQPFGSILLSLFFIV